MEIKISDGVGYQPGFCIFTCLPAAIRFFLYVMKLFAKPPGFFLILFLMTFSCRKVFNPPAIKAGNHYLAVDGFIHTGTNVSAAITISRSLNLNDSVPNIPELNAQVNIQSSNGNSYSLYDTSGNGIYVSPALNLDSSLKYQLTITSNDGNKYISDFVTAESAPPIDSLAWELVNDPLTLQQAVNVYVNSHDVNNNTHY